MKNVLCITCGVEFSMTDFLHDQRKRDCEVFHCPNGHRQVFNRSDDTRIARIADLEGTVAFLRTEVGCAESRIRSLRGANTRLRRAIKKLRGGK